MQDRIFEAGLDRLPGVDQAGKLFLETLLFGGIRGMRQSIDKGQEDLSIALSSLRTGGAPDATSVTREEAGTARAVEVQLFADT